MAADRRSDQHRDDLCAVGLRTRASVFRTYTSHAINYYWFGGTASCVAHCDAVFAYPSVLGTVLLDFPMQLKKRI
jgi:hypothetical protein